MKEPNVHSQPHYNFISSKHWEWIDDTHTTWHWLKPDDLTMNQFHHSYAIQGGVGYPSAHPIWFESKMWDRQEDPIEASLGTDRFRKPATDCGVLLWPTIKWSAEDSETLSFILPECQTYYKASAVDFITGGRDIDAEWDSYLRMIALMDNGCYEQALSEVRGYFGFMAEANGALWEFDSTRGSCCHGFAAYAGVILLELKKHLGAI